MTDPIIGERFAVKGHLGSDPNVYEFVGDSGCDPAYRYGLKLVSTSELGRRYGHIVGRVMRVERAWFDVRGEMPASAVGSVRRVS